ncbi:MAG TPA: hypothetical protein DCF63_06070, partial [Planctomycetaceae bacterium]|nr:hypothetical protein [Planctomycetaceae bacterium]
MRSTAATAGCHRLAHDLGLRERIQNLSSRGRLISKNFGTSWHRFLSTRNALQIYRNFWRSEINPIAGHFPIWGQVGRYLSGQLRP